MVDLVLTIFCALTLLVLAFAKCGTGSKEEEIFDTLLLVARNVLQFGRLAAVMRQYVFNKAITGADDECYADRANQYFRVQSQLISIRREEDL